ncbi:hypothetical protein W97_04258 [Coniosporium apollinis CBS 100218]|uniref:Fe2OG dioxygenase domain-containing protein n=1 Tax=Coniosporium apollinis (strain CBS 100218) TaxID=1168221 RepID=R7YT59_CONA1|nr:uncharacterized protein W97_04258 [Coniosporium apollinis CBS 100218]EON65023.1 hypothetical protein W97_04258 [Coniosporium apollinis CBS 100218]
MTSAFDPAKHLAFTPPSQIIKMKDLGFSETVGVSPVAVSEPFQMFSSEAIQQMRAEILKPEVMEQCNYRSNIAACQLRGYSSRYAPFIHDAWTHPDTLAIVSKIAGVDLVPVMNFEIGHINISVKTEEQSKSELAAIARQKRLFADDEGIAGCPWEDDRPVVGWHTDSYPFVCVLMLSDCTNMVGGETALQTGYGDILKVRGPQMGCAVVLQGRYITHQALRALGAQERITMVTSFRPRSAHIADDTVLTSVRPISDLSELYYEFGEYRMEILEERLRAKLKHLRERRQAGKKLDTKDFKKFLAEQEAFLKHMNNEMLEEEKVAVGYIDEIVVPEVKVGEELQTGRSVKRARNE